MKTAKKIASAKKKTDTKSKFKAPDFTGFSNDAKLATLDSLFTAFSQLKEPVSAAPTYTPTNFYDSIVYYKSGATHRVYFYTTEWRYAAVL